MSSRGLRLPDDVTGPDGSTDGRRRLVQPRAARPKIIRRGMVASLLAPLASAVAVLALVVGLAAIGGNWWSGYSRDLIFRHVVQPDASVATVETGPPLEETATLLVRDVDGEVRRLVTERSAADRYVNETLRRLDAERARIKAAADAEIETLFSLAFADVDEAVDRYADWFFAWSRSYVVLKEAMVSTATRLAQVGSYEPLQVAVERDLEQYFQRHYTAQVLKPEQRDALITRAFEQAARRAHERWLEVLAQEDLRLQLFLARHTRHLEQPRTDRPMSGVALDWDAQRFKAPAYLTEGQAFAGVLSVAMVGTGGTLGALTLRPAIERGTAGLFVGLGRRYAASFGGRIAMARTGAALGGAVQPVAGTALGALAGGLIGLAADYGLNEANAAFSREAFVTTNREAVQLTIDLWQDRLGAALLAAVDQWFDDTRAAVVRAP
jgi:hypothetical protein